MRFDLAFPAPLELLSPAETARADALAPSFGAPVEMLMENAGRAVARVAMARLRPRRTLVLCGPGNNGGDGYVAARHLAQAGWPVAVAALAAPKPGGEAAAVARRWRGPTVPFAAAEAARAELVIDAVFGAGLARPLDPAIAETLGTARELLAVDVPSGLDGATGGILGYAPRCALTVTFFRLKPGHLLLPGRDLCGELHLADIGLPATVLPEIGGKTFANGPALWRLPQASAADHKYTRGHLTVLGGAAMTGAARLAAAGARRAGAGLVTIAARGSADIYRTGDPGVIVTDAPLAELALDERRGAWVCGPGLGAEAARECLPMLLAAGKAAVADADALTAFAGNAEGASRRLGSHPARRGVFPAVRRSRRGPADRGARGGGAYRRGCRAERQRHHYRGARRPRRHQRLGTSLACHGRHGRRARRHHRGVACPGDAGVGRGGGRGVAAWPRRAPRRLRPHR